MFPAASTAMNAGRTGLFSSLFRNGINWSSILTNTQKTLGIVNQAIPVIKQASPIVNNAKTMFKVMNEFKKFDKGNSKATNATPTTNQNNEKLNNNNNNNNNNNSSNTVNYNNPINDKTHNITYAGPTFFA